ncbi:imidazolonepropionase-like amidohydrolase [Luteibacter sp. Sphag1AF]|uniref:amidohydrolase family protein n=1 Tax=Luteibacter sp. Sphag1AF TaxID=2587031 RepID=UPI0018067342|nr:amidohydrolase family protein [Luteibacter sp. Sphag1AF]MBB3229123.1 imidazolonepropionase-like amidohydrolase [Luteibacter sp. Sphag1AF]
MTRYSPLVAALLLAIAAPCALAQDATVIRGARVIDGRGGPAIEDATLIIRGEHIQMLGAGIRVKMPDGTKVVDYEGKTIIPGLVSDHSHIGQVEGAQSGNPDFFTRENSLRQLRQWEVYGVTTITSLGVNNPAVFYPLRAELHAGSVPGADLFGADHGIGVPNGAPPATMMKAGPNQLDRPATVAEAKAAVDAAAARGTDIIKIWVDDFNGTLPVKMKPEIYKAVIREAHAKHLRVAAHLYYLDDARKLVDAGIDIVAHGVRDKPVDAAFIQSMRKRNVWYIPTLDLNEAAYIYAQHPAWMDTPFFQHAVQPDLARQFADPAWKAKALDGKALSTNEQALAMNLKNLKMLHDAGVRIGFGTDSGATPLRIPGFAEHRELELMVQAGLTPMEAIHIATDSAAQLLNLDDRGVLEKGRLADFVVLDADPSTDISATQHIEAVWHRGRQVSGKVEAFTP